MPIDKQLHVVGGALSALLGILLARLFELDIDPFWMGISSGAVAGLAKEMYDGTSGKGNVEALDFVATVGGALLISLPFIQF